MTAQPINSTKAKPPGRRGLKRSGGGSLLRINHLLGGSTSSTFTQELNLALAGITEEMALDEG